MQKLKSPVIFVLTLTVVWGLIRLLKLPEFTSEIIAKPVVWLGITLAFFWFKQIPTSVLRLLRTQFLTSTPVWKTILLPLLGMLAFSLLFNFRNQNLASLAMQTVIFTLVINFATALVEEFVFRGVLYVWLLQLTSELRAFLFVQAGFLVIHLAMLFTTTTTVSQFLVRVYFIVFFSVIHTLVFRVNKSLQSSTVTHGVWNFINQLSLLTK
jgi:membrane protease YdiL (CAAX protease family)